MDIDKMSDEECLTTFIEFLDKARIVLDTGFVSDPETGNLTHQIMQVTCGDYVTVSQPEPLEVILQPATDQSARRDTIH